MHASKESLKDSNFIPNIESKVVSKNVYQFCDIFPGGVPSKINELLVEFALNVQILVALKTWINTVTLESRVKPFIQTYVKVL